MSLYHLLATGTALVYYIKMSTLLVKCNSKRHKGTFQKDVSSIAQYVQILVGFYNFLSPQPVSLLQLSCWIFYLSTHHNHSQMIYAQSSFILLRFSFYLHILIFLIVLCLQILLQGTGVFLFYNYFILLLSPQVTCLKAVTMHIYVTLCCLVPPPLLFPLILQLLITDESQKTINEEAKAKNGYFGSITKVQ